MITLLEACKLIRLEDSEVCFLKEKNKIDYEVVTGKDIRNKLNMKAVKVVSITPKFAEYDFRGMMLEIIK